MKKHIILFLVFFFTLQSSTFAGPARFKMKRAGTLSGQAMVNNIPLDEAIVAFFLVKKGLPPVESGMRRIPESLGATNADGKFSVKLLAGTYYVGMLDRPEKDRGTIGPPRGDEKFFFAANQDGTLQQVTIKDYEQKDMGVINGNTPDTFNVSSESIAVSGHVIDASSGQPMEHMAVFAKQKMSQTRPDFISDRTGKDGAFFIRLPPEKAYYLFARKNIANVKPGAGTSMGIYGLVSSTGYISPLTTGVGSPPPGALDADQQELDTPRTISGTAGTELTGLKIYMYPVPDAEMVKISIRGTNQALKLGGGAAMNNIFFAFDSAILEELSFDELDRWSDFMKGSPDKKIEISGHTDSKGSDAYNQRLSENRAKAVIDYLVSKDIPVERMKSIGYGETRPVADNTTEAGRERNRRVEIKFVD